MLLFVGVFCLGGCVVGDLVLIAVIGLMVLGFVFAYLGRVLMFGVMLGRPCLVLGYGVYCMVLCVVWLLILVSADGLAAAIWVVVIVCGCVMLRGGCGVLWFWFIYSFLTCLLRYGG